MSCGCGGKCCAETRGPLAVVAGLALLNARPSTGLGFLYWGGESGGGGDWWDDLTQDEYNYLFDTYGGSGRDFWNFEDPYWAYDPSGTFFYDTTSERFLPAPAGNVPLASAPVNWWEYFLPSFGGGGNAPAPNLPGYCPGGTYHPIDDPYACVPFPVDPVTGKPTRPRQTAQQKPQPAKKSAPKVSPQNPQPCPAPGRTNPATGKCECPKGLLYDAKTQRCIPATLSNRLTQPGPGGFPWWLLLLGGAVVIKAASNSGKK